MGKGKIRTVSTVALDDATHTNGRRALEKGAGNNGVGARNGIAAAGDGEHPVMNALNHLAYTSLYASFVAKVGDVLATFSNDDARLLGGDNGAQSQLSLGIFLVRLRGELPVGAESFVHLQLVQRVDNVAAVGGKQILRSRHDCCMVGGG